MTGESERTLTALDAAARRLVAAAAPVRFAVARTDAERAAVFRLRHATAVGRGWAPAAAFPDGQERDAADDVAVLVAGWAGAAVVATGRIVFPAPGRRLPTETAFGLAAAPAQTAANVDRMAVARGHGGGDHRLLLGLLGAIWREVRAGGYHAWLGIHSRPVIRLYRLLGLEVEVLGPPRTFWGEERVPVRFDGRTGATAFLRRQPAGEDPTP